VKLSIVIPSYNEERRLPGTVRHIRSYLDGSGRNYELILVDDGSTDGTLRLMRQLERDCEQIRVLSLEINQGKGRAVAEGVRVSRGEMVLFSDSDLSTPIEELPKLEQALEAGADIAFGSRAAPGSREVNQAIYRQIMGKVFNVTVRLLLLPGVKDSQCGFKLLRTSVAKELFGALHTGGFAFDVEILWRARQAGYRAVEVPVRWLNSDATRVSPLRHSAQMFRDLVSLRLQAQLGSQRRSPR
jgi:dolichyl-phosphate beta-glucosyltransferase